MQPTSKELQFSHYYVNQDFSAEATMQSTVTLILYMLCPLMLGSSHIRRVFKLEFFFSAVKLPEVKEVKVAFLLVFDKISISKKYCLW